MTQEEIRSERAAIRDEISRLDGLVLIELAKLKALQGRCKHPNEKMRRDYTGEASMICPDCENED